VKREVSYQWRLREVMVAHGMFTVTELVPLLHDRSIDLSASQVHRLASGTPERLPMPPPARPRSHPAPAAAAAAAPSAAVGRTGPRATPA
jgi:hypothetical protein